MAVNVAVLIPKVKLITTVYLKKYSSLVLRLKESSLVKPFSFSQRRGQALMMDG